MLRSSGLPVTTCYRLNVWLAACLAVFVVSMMVGCAPQAQTGATDDTPTSTSSAWSSDMTCSTCHVAEQAATEASTHVDQTCESCHGEPAALTEAHAGATSDGQMPKKLKKTTIAEAVCLGCHKSYDDLATRTESPTVLTDTQGTVINPHALPKVAEHGDIVCTSCHKLHAVDSLVETASEACSGCHHQGVFECGTCHE